MSVRGQGTYRIWAATESSLPVWHQPWWLDATAGPESWDAVFATNETAILVALPYVKKRTRGFTILTQPPLTQSLGPWFKGGVAPSLSRQHRVLGELLTALPQTSAYLQNWMPEISNWLPYYWAGYQQSTRYTYRLDLGGDEDSLWAGLRGECRTAIRKGEERFGLRVHPTREVDKLVQLASAVFERKGLRLPYNPGLIAAILRAGSARDAANVYLVVDRENEPHAALLVLRDGQRSYYLIGGVSDLGLQSRAMNVGMWHAIREARDSGSTHFDFEGSMIQSIEAFFRSFGATQTPYFRVWRHHNPLLRIGMRLRGR